MALAQTAWVRFLDDDDYLISASLQEMAAQTAGADALTCNAATGKPGGGFDVHGVEMIYTSQIAVRKEAFADVLGFEDKIRYQEERDLLDRMVRAGKVIRHVPVLGVVRSGHIGIRPAALGTGESLTREDVQTRRRLARVR